MPGPGSVTSPLALELREISKRFGNVEALSRVSLQMRRGSVHALLGENGAGKICGLAGLAGRVHAPASLGKWVETR